MKEFGKELFIPSITVFVLLMVQEGDQGTGKSFLTIMVPVYIPSSFVGLCRQLLVEYVHEKTNKYRDLYKIMGMKLQNYRIAWFITYIIKSVIIGLMIPLTLLYKMNFQQSLEIVFCFMLFILAQVGQTLLLSTFFSNSQLAGEFGSFFQTILSTFYFAPLYQMEYLVYICPQSIISFYLMNKLNGSNVESVTSYCILSLSVHLVAYYFLFNFLEEQCMKAGRCFWTRRSKTDYVQLEDQMEMRRQYDEEGLAFTSVEIVKLFKQYGDVVAVDNLNLKIYSQQILCILGQNGAGKTTTLNILTGLLEKTSGKILYFGKTFEKKRDEIQKLIGFCPQENLLYDQLTVYESLQYQCMMRGTDSSSEIERWLNLMQLQQYSNYKTHELSGGNKRKLQIALALVGGSQIIFLDEPTASIDPESRRQIWQILKDIKQINKTLILTTHFLDEAEELADRIAIMKQGQIKIYGSPENIKKELEVGFTLTFGNIQSSEQQSQIKQLFYELECSSGSQLEYDNIKYILNQNQLFSIVEKVYELSKTQNIKIQLVQNTLEAAYLKLNKDHLEDDKIIKEYSFPIKSTHDIKTKQLLQISALLQKKYYVLKRNFTLQLMLILPMLILLLAYLFGYHLLQGETQIQVFVSIFISQSFSLNSSIFINTPILERELKIRQQLKQMRMSQFTYIFGTFLGDYLIILIVITFIYALSLQVEMLLSSEQLLIILGLFGLSVISFSYAASFMFSSNQSAIKIFPVINFLFGYLLPSMIDLQLQNQLREVFTYMFPLYALNLALRDISQDYSVYFIAQFIFYMFIYQTLEKHFVLFENRQDLQDRNNKLLIQNIQFGYNQNKQVLKQIDLQLFPQKILTLLGPNGAGKTTLIQLITDCLKSNWGSIMYNENTIISSCQQSEGLWEDLTAEEILHLYAKIKGSIRNVKNEVSQILRILSIKGKIVNMSGGQKRKVALAISLIGDSGIIILDEPSNGLDPISRRNLQNMIQAHVQKRNSSIILTTHDMDEAQYLSDSIGFIINGSQPFPQQSTAQLIEQYGSGILLTIRAKNKDALDQIILAFPKHQKEGLLIVIKLGNDYDVPTTIRILKNLCQEDLIASFSIKQANLEQVFLRQCRKQYNED
ncbi:unnamed protein product (macronuclear) [Paramecium tetraurelia]|uniref:ABC transporter domain-containing protein n=1 Tax=Paramecium tetraurelia TaxID=5888 RepID=A0C5V5_PARTE|nr:uncharacterized protein GSPATT00035301001 [Paramecium tetraurelia]CAK66172.1 unnamed protein product [Paramecium tetraurelia]|eukprot:XP_001433569.1 hypothetical protein (macronuclear) [Paramecium tetraurelia strain d4-2]